VTVETISGLFRGICVDNEDPEGLGRIRVQVPQVLGTAASGWAFPAWSFHDLTIWPQDRIPKPGDGVWIMFEATSPDKMIWIAAFGPQDLINQPGFAPVYSYTTSLTLVVPALNWNEAAKFTGVLTSDGGGIPNPNPEVYLQALPAGETEWISVAKTTVTALDGSWDIDYIIDIPGVVDYRAVFPGVGVYGPSESTTGATDTATATSVSTPSFPTLYHGTGLTVYGKVTAATGERVTTGYVQLWWRYLVGADTNWKQATTPGSPPVVDGVYTLTNGPLGHIGPTEWQVRYFGGDQFLDSVSTAVQADVGLRPGPSITKGSVSYGSAAFSWGAISGATSYDIQRKVNSGAWSTLASGGTTRSYTNSGLSPSTYYSYRVRPRATDPAGTVVYGNWGPVAQAYTGRPEQRDNSSSDWIYINVRARNSHSITGGWRNDGEARQGYYLTSYGGQGYIGIFDYGTNGVRDKVRSSLGGGTTGYNRQRYGSCFAAEVELSKESDVGNQSQVTITFYTSDRGTSGSRPNLEGSAYSTKSGGYGSNQWYPCSWQHGWRLGDGNSRSLAIYRNDKTNYAAFRGGRLRLKWKWNYVTVSYQAPRWT
jgi:hypothetical protein